MKHIILCLFTWCSVLPLNAQKNNNAIGQYLRGVYKNHVIPGFAVTVVSSDKIIYSSGFGVVKQGATKVFSATTPVSAGSIMKSFTALAIVQLAEEGKLSLNDPVIKYLPWFRTANKERSDQITIKMLINNTSGLVSGGIIPSYDLSETAIEKFVRNLSSVFIYKKPGASYEYSNAGFIVAGFIVSKVSGYSFSAYIKKKIFEPLGMLHTTIDITEIDKLSPSFGHYPSAYLSIPAKRERNYELVEYSPTGSLLYTSASDMSKYLLALLNKQKVISDNAKKLLFQPNVQFPGLSKEDGGNGKPYAYGLGWMISEIEGRQIIHHGGSTGRSSSFTMIDVKNNIAATIVMNSDVTFINKYQYLPAYTILNNVLRITAGLRTSDFGKPRKKDPTINTFEPAEASLKKFEGEYRLKKGNDILVYYGVDMKILRSGNNALEAIIYRGNQTVNRFLLDFTNNSVAVSRNSAQPSLLQFKLTANGAVKSVVFNSIEFVKEESLINTKQFKKITFGNVAESKIPPNFVVKTSGNTTSIHSVSNDVIISVCFETKKTPIDHYLIPPDSASILIRSDSPVFTQTIGPNLWKQKTYLYTDKNMPYHIAYFACEKAGSIITIVVKTSNDRITTIIQSVVQPFLEHFRVMKNSE